LNDKTQAAQDPLDAFVQEAIDQDSVETTEAAQTTESAPVENAKETTTETTEAEKPTEEGGVQKRINKITADKHEEIRKREAETKRADDLQAKLDKIEANKPTLEQPTLEQHDYDEEAFNKATVNFQVQEQVKAELATQNAKQNQINLQAESDKVQATFNERVEALGKEDYVDKANAVPVLPDGVAAAIMSLDNGPEMVYHLGEHLDKADALANMSPMAAMMELGKISAEMSVKPEIKTSAAPDPIEPVSAGSALPSDLDGEMSIEDWMAKFN